jgi:hypothetical protein
LVYFSRFGILCQEKSGNPYPDQGPAIQKTVFSSLSYSSGFVREFLAAQKIIWFPHQPKIFMSLLCGLNIGDSSKLRREVRWGWVNKRSCRRRMTRLGEILPFGQVF